MSFSLQINASEDDLPIYQEVEQSPDVVVEERELSDLDDDDEDEKKKVDVQNTTKPNPQFTTLKSIFSGNVQKNKSPTFVFEQTVTPKISVKGISSDCKPVSRFASVRSTNKNSLRSALRAALGISGN